MCSRSILSVGKIEHQVWCDPPFSQRNRITEPTMGVGLGDDREVGVGGDKFWKKVEEVVGNVGGGLYKIRELANFLLTM